MLILDTNVASEMMKSQAERRVVEWLNAQDASQVFITSTSKAEIAFGIETLPAGKRRDLFRRALIEMFETRFLERVLPFDEAAADVFGLIAAERRRLGRPISQFDCQIAAIARTRGASVATRNSGDFADCGVELINPWA